MRPETRTNDSKYYLRTTTIPTSWEGRRKRDFFKPLIVRLELGALVKVILYYYTFDAGFTFSPGYVSPPLLRVISNTVVPGPFTWHMFKVESGDPIGRSEPSYCY